MKEKRIISPHTSPQILFHGSISVESLSHLIVFFVIPRCSIPSNVLSVPFNCDADHCHPCLVDTLLTSCCGNKNPTLQTLSISKPTPFFYRPSFSFFVYSLIFKLSLFSNPTRNTSPVTPTIFSVDPSSRQLEATLANPKQSVSQASQFFGLLALPPLTLFLAQHTPWPSHFFFLDLLASSAHHAKYLV